MCEPDRALDFSATFVSAASWGKLATLNVLGPIEGLLNRPS
jgi:hypothetical protein